MVGDPLSHAVASFRIIDEVKKLLENASASMDSDPGRAYEKLKNWKEKRAVLSPPGVGPTRGQKSKEFHPCHVNHQVSGPFRVCTRARSEEVLSMYSMTNPEQESRWRAWQSSTTSIGSQMEKK